MAFHLFCNEKGLTEVSFCTRKSAVRVLKGKTGSRGDTCWLSGCQNLPKHNGALLDKYVCVHSVADSTLCLWIVFLVEGEGGCILSKICFRLSILCLDHPPIMVGFNYLWQHWGILDLGSARGLPLEESLMGQSPSSAEAGWSLRSPYAPSAACALGTPQLGLLGNLSLGLWALSMC